MKQELIQEGAEAKIFKKIDAGKTSIIKQRINKKYRISAINKLLIPSRTRREVKVMKKLKELKVRVPEIIATNKIDTIEIEFIKGEKLRDVLDKNITLAKDIGKILAIVHDANIVHGDLTTSNMIFEDNINKNNKNKYNNKICLIDFGLSQFSQRLEDKAVDIHLFKQALESKHHKVFDKAYKLFLQGYKPKKNYNEILKRLEIVESRGRNIGKN